MDAIKWTRDDGEYRAEVNGIRLEIYKQCKTWGWAAIRKGANRTIGFSPNLKTAKQRAERAAVEWPTPTAQE